VKRRYTFRPTETPRLRLRDGVLCDAAGNAVATLAGDVIEVLGDGRRCFVYSWWRSAWRDSATKQVWLRSRRRGFALRERMVYGRYTMNADRRFDAGGGRGYAVYSDARGGSPTLTLQWVGGDLRRGEAVLDMHESPEALLLIVVAFVDFHTACITRPGGGG
jgi:hypothetical protein